MFSVEQLAYNVVLQSIDEAAGSKSFGFMLDRIEQEVLGWLTFDSMHADRPSEWHFNKWLSKGYYNLQTGSEEKRCLSPALYREHKLFCDYYAWYLITSKKVALGHESVPRPLAEVYQNCPLYNGEQPWYTRVSYFTCMTEISLGAAIKEALSDSPVERYAPLGTLRQALDEIRFFHLLAVEKAATRTVEE